MFEMTRCKIGKLMELVAKDRVLIDIKKCKITKRTQAHMNNLVYHIGCWLKKKIWIIAPAHIGTDPITLKIAQNAEKVSHFKPGSGNTPIKISCIGSVEVSLETNKQLKKCEIIEPGKEPDILDTESRAKIECTIGHPASKRMDVSEKSVNTTNIIEFEQKMSMNRMRCKGVDTGS